MSARILSVKNYCAIRLFFNKNVVKNNTALNVVSRRNLTTTPVKLNNRLAELDQSTNLAKDVIIFKYENPRFFKFLNIFAVTQFIFWSYLSHFAFTTLKDAPIDRSKEDDLPWYRRINLGENKFRNTIAVFCFVVGYGVLGASWAFTLRSVRYLILRKGGNSVSLVTYGPFGKNRMMDVPLKCISATESRQAARVHLPIKVQNRSMFYILDMRGEFLNTRIYDYTVGLKRKFAS